MSNVVKLKKYLIGENGYFLNELSNGKVIMLSGEWGSGKTHFWHLSDDSIKAKLDQKEKPNIYISLYGKSSLQEIENEVFTKAYYKSKGRDDNKKDVIEKLSSTFSKLSSYVDEVSPLKVTPVIDFLETLKKDSQENRAEELMEEGLIIAFDDFERKSTHINLNDLFGFITNLAIQYKATIVIILNDDVFEGKEKEIFTNVKEKTVSKYLKFTPTSTELFEIIFNKYSLDEKYKTIILDAINEFGLLNARIYENVLGNFQEYVEKYIEMTEQEIRFFVLTLINFNLNHIVFKLYGYKSDFGDNWKLPVNFTEFKELPSDLLNAINQQLTQSRDKLRTQSELMDMLEKILSSAYRTVNATGEKSKPTEKLREDIKRMNKYANIIWSYWRLETKLEYRKDIDETSIRQMNDFIETGIL
jgi:hypothetical protein